MIEKQRVHELVEQLLPAATVAASRYVEFLIAHEEAKRGSGISHEVMLGEFGA